MALHHLGVGIHGPEDAPAGGGTVIGQALRPGQAGKAQGHIINGKAVDRDAAAVLTDVDRVRLHPAHMGHQLQHLPLKRMLRPVVIFQRVPLCKTGGQKAGVLAGAVTVPGVQLHMVPQLLLVDPGADGIGSAALQVGEGKAQLFQNALDHLLVVVLSVVGGTHNGQLLIGKGEPVRRSAEEDI